MTGRVKNGPIVPPKVLTDAVDSKTPFLQFGATSIEPRRFGSPVSGGARNLESR